MAQTSYKRKTNVLYASHYSNAYSPTPQRQLIYWSNVLQKDDGHTCGSKTVDATSLQLFGLLFWVAQKTGCW